jgi:hypothetical protein
MKILVKRMLAGRLFGLEEARGNKILEHTSANNVNLDLGIRARYPHRARGHKRPDGMGG